MSISKVAVINDWIGIDVSKGALDVYFLVDQRQAQFSNDPTGIAQLIGQLVKRDHPAVVCEASGGYEQAMANALHGRGIHVSIVNPKQVRDLAKGLGKLAKTDSIDAQVLARFGEVNQPAATVFASKAEAELKELVTRRQQLVEILTAEKNRVQQVKGKVKKSIAAHIKWLKKRIETLDDEIKALSESNQAWQQHKAVLQSTKGIGEVISSSLLILLPELGQVSNKAIAAIAGVAPYNKDSGGYRGQRHIWGGRATVRSLLYMATLSALRANPPIKALYKHLLSKGKAKKVAIVACMRKLLICLNSMVRHDQKWDNNKVTIRYKST